jgi:hypothetical protein
MTVSRIDNCRFQLYFNALTDHESKYFFKKTLEKKCTKNFGKVKILNIKVTFYSAVYQRPVMPFHLHEFPIAMCKKLSLFNFQ